MSTMSTTELAGQQLTELEAKVLKALSRAGNNRVSVEELAERVGCKTETIYSKLQEAGFRRLFLEVMNNTVVADVPEVLNSVRDAAKQGQYQQAKMILELAGVYENRTKVEATVHVGENPFKDDAERREFLRRTLESNPALLDGKAVNTDTLKTYSVPTTTALQVVDVESEDDNSDSDNDSDSDSDNDSSDNNDTDGGRDQC